MSDGFGWMCSVQVALVSSGGGGEMVACDKGVVSP
jgi:hypothetical protein